MGGGIFPYPRVYFPHANNLELIFSTEFVDKIIKGNVIYNLLYQVVVNMGKYLQKKGKV